MLHSFKNCTNVRGIGVLFLVVFGQPYGILCPEDLTIECVSTLLRGIADAAN